MRGGGPEPVSLAGGAGLFLLGLLLALDQLDAISLSIGIAAAAVLAAAGAALVAAGLSGGGGDRGE